MEIGSPVIRVDNLIKDYPGLRAVDTLNLNIEAGEIYGFLGLNGAGKTTTIRSLLGMIKPTLGSVSLFGEKIGPWGEGPWEKVGHLVESPAAYPELTVRENLLYAARYYANIESHRVAEVINLLALGRYSDRKASTLSSGNKQRLGIARAILHQPQLLILDEPANALDPAGVVEIREMLKAFSRERGVTVFMSSHILSEVDKIADRIGIIHEGKLLEEYRSGDILTNWPKRLRLHVTDVKLAMSILSSQGHQCELEKGDIFISSEPALSAPELVARQLVDAGVLLQEMRIVQDGLEEHFLQLTGRRS